jgi:uncharacterized coiled-coil protein SlyX
MEMVRFVFERTTTFALDSLETFVKTYKHLPDIPSEQQLKEEGLNVNEMFAKQMQKIEELTLYIIEQQKQIEKLKSEIEQMKQEKK